MSPGDHVFWWIKFLVAIFVEGLPGYIPVKFG